MLYKVFVLVNAAGYITAVESSEFLPDTAGWTEIDSGTGDRYLHAQGNFFPTPIITEGGAYRYKMEDGAPVECTAEDIAKQEAANQPEPEPPAGESSVWDDLDGAYQEGVDSV